jgi:hypothetical protein
MQDSAASHSRSALGASEPGQLLIRLIVESNPDVRLMSGVPLVLIAGVVATAIVVDLLGGVIFDFALVATTRTELLVGSVMMRLPSARQ